METTELKIEVVTSESEHWYPSPKKKDKYYPSVTTYLSVYPKGVGFNKYLVAQSSWESSQEILKSAGQRGTRVHLGTCLLEEGQELVRDSYSLEEWEMLMGFVDWREKYNPKLVYSEKSLVSDKLKTGGTIDRIYEIDGRNTLLDLKTSSQTFGNYWVQAAAYAKLAEEKLGIKIEDTAILRVRELKGNCKSRYDYKLHTKEEWVQDFKVFPSIQKIWNHINPEGGPRILEIPITLKLIL